MWNNAALLSAISGWCLWISAITGTIAAVSGLLSGITANRASDLTSASARLKIAQAEQAAAEAKYATAKLWKEVSWRVLDPATFETLVNELRDLGPWEPWLTYVGADPECQIFRSELARAFEAAGWKTRYYSGWKVAAGLSVLGQETEEKRAIEDAFRRAGLEFRSEPASNFSPGDIVIVVGSRPPPNFPIRG